MSASADLVRLRIADDEAADERTRAPAPESAGAPARVVRTTTLSAYPAAASAFYAVAPLDVGGPEVEGGPATLTDQPGTFLAYNLGTAVPPPGSVLVVTLPGRRWVFRYDG